MSPTIIEQSEGPQIVLDGRPSMRAIKSTLGITGRRAVLVRHVRNEKEYRLAGTAYRFCVITAN